MRVPVTVRTEVQAPPEQREDAPQEVPSGSGVGPSTQTDVPVAHEVVPARQEPGFWQGAFATHAVQAPPLQTWSVPHTVPFGSAVVVSTQVDVPVAQEVLPVRQGSGFVSQAASAVHARQAPALQTWFAPQGVPFASCVTVFSQVWVPDEHEVVPATHGFGFVVQPAPAVQAVHAPALQTWFVPQTVPFALGVVPFTHIWVPVAQEVTPTRQGSGFPPQASPSVQGVHTPPLQTSGAVGVTSQVVPFAFAAPSTQVEVPVEQEVTPEWQAPSGLVVQASPAVHGVQRPPLQTRFEPQGVPFGSGAAALSPQVCVPVLHEVVPVRHGSGFVAHARPAVQDVHVPALHTRFVPQAVPFAFSGPSWQTDVPVEHEVTPRLHSGSGLVEQPTPAVHARHAPALQTRFVPQLVPFASAFAVSTQTDVPVAQEVAPEKHEPGFWQGTSATHVEQTPPSQTLSGAHTVPSGS
jgi:hypothetical protein